MLVYRHKKNVRSIPKKKEEKKTHEVSPNKRNTKFLGIISQGGTIYIEIYVMLFKQNGIDTRRTSEILAGYMATLKFELK